jgi:uncharacterized membrane protein YgdD (TMEM256/DUF423 family)
MRTFEAGHVLLILAGAFGASAVATGAFASHGLANAVGPAGAERAVALWTTGSHYQMVHAVILAVVADLRLRASRDRALLALAGAFFTAGCLLFPVALYGLGYWGPSMLGAVAPIGGLCLILGWLVLCVVGVRFAGSRD